MSVTIDAKPQPMPEPPLPKAEPCVVVIFGASGDLTKRMLVPALARLWQAESLPPSFAILGVDLKQMTDDEFRQHLREGIFAAGGDGDGITEESWSRFAERLSYIKGELENDQTYRSIREKLERLASQGSSANHLFYCSTPPTLAPAIVKGLGAAGLADEAKGWSRIVIEKPFGRDLESAKKLNAEIASVFEEHQVYRIDHYLGKETVQNLLVFRFGNSLFEPVWNRNNIDYVEITAAESVGVESRAAFYEETVALRDMVANHLLQLIALTAMEPPIAFDADAVREQKVQLLRSIRPMNQDEVARCTVRGQYGPGHVDEHRVPGYR